MGFNNQYPNRKDWRKPYYKSQRFDRSCRCHGGCPWCERNRLHFDRKYRFAADEQIREYDQLESR